MNLRRHEFLFLDCQTTGMHPSSGHLLEVAWARASAQEGKTAEPRSFLLRLPEGAEIPRRVTELTGIKEAHLEGAADPAVALAALRDEFHEPEDIALVHYAQFERAFLEHSYQDGKLPFRLLCSYQIARRLFPNLPSRNIRGLLGYFGENAGEIRRAAAHVRATQKVWQHLARELEGRGVKNLAALDAWLAEKPKKRTGPFEYRLDRLKRLELPDQPGVYRMLSHGREVLYVGKATSLRSRVNSYFRGRKGRDRRKLEMLSQVWDIEVKVCATPLEAALLENEEIKRLDPPYNVQLKAGQRRLVFYSREFCEAAFEQGERHRLGPFRESNGIEVLRAWLEAQESGDWEGFFYESIPEDVLRAGLEIFSGRHGPRIRLRELLATGMKILRGETRAGIGMEEDVAEGEAVDGESQEGPIEPDEVAARLERVAARAAAECRRARALTRLLNSRISWESEAGPREIEIRGGRILGPGRERGAATAQPWEGLEIADYDRMSVLLTEMRREGCHCEPLPR